MQTDDDKDNGMTKLIREQGIFFSEHTHHLVKDCPHKKEHVQMANESQGSDQANDCNTVFQRNIHGRSCGEK